MSNLKVHRAAQFKLGTLAVVLVWALPLLLWAQDSKAQSSSPALRQPFAEISESLTMKADTLLIAADEPVPTAVEATPDIERQPMPSQIVNPSAAVARVELLRPAIDPILRGEGVPVELAAVVLVESGGNTAALSPKGARGLWQLMPDTARRYGLVVDGARDERVDIEKSTRAAARYLSDLHLQFGSWPLALAAYNTGEQNLQRAINRSRSAEFTVLSSTGRLPSETISYVPAVLAATRSFGQPFVLEVPRPAPAATTVFAVSSR
ncbi:MAG: lytic transglycosylase domain-containing protein [Acidobacteriota bacterium]|nr:lytic transglycosylase domain-containing protein [Acidobacteriota bacterium]